MIENPPIFRLSLPPGSEPRPPASPSRRGAPVEANQATYPEAARLGVFPAVYRNIQATAPAAVDKAWDHRFRGNAARNLALESAQIRLLGVLRDEGIGCIPAKGVQLTRLLYPDLSWREIADIDLLVPAEDLPRAYRCLKDQGLADTENPWNADALGRLARRPAFLYPELHLVGPHDVLVELHWDWTGERLPEHDPAEDPEAYLVYLCRHAGKHFWSSLRWSADIELYVRKFGGGLDWDRFWRLAREAGAERSCAASFQLCSRLFERPLQPAEQRGPTRAGRKLSERAELSLKRPEPVGLRSHPVVRLLEVDSPKQRALRCLSLMAPAPRHWTLPSGGRRSWAGVWLGRYRRLALEAAAALCPFPVWTRRLRKAALLSACDWFLLARAWVLLAGVKPAIRFLAFSRLEPWATRVRRKAAATDDETAGSETAATIRRTVLLVDAAARRHFVAMDCLPRSLVTARLLGQKGIRTDLKIGVREEKGRIAGHAWVEYENEAINDGGGYRTYSVFPDRPSAEKAAR